MSQDNRDNQGMPSHTAMVAAALRHRQAAEPLQIQRYSPEAGEVERFRRFKARAEVFVEHLMNRHRSGDLWQDDSFICVKGVEEPLADIVVQLLKKRYGWDACIRQEDGGTPGLVNLSRGGGGVKEIRIRNPIFLLDSA